jgi:hypothetical protein
MWLQTIIQSGWKWIVRLDDKRTKTGTGYSR